MGAWCPQMNEHFRELQNEAKVRSRCKSRLRPRQWRRGRLNSHHGNTAPVPDSMSWQHGAVVCGGALPLCGSAMAATAGNLYGTRSGWLIGLKLVGLVVGAPRRDPPLEVRFATTGPMGPHTWAEARGAQSGCSRGGRARSGRTHAARTPPPEPHAAEQPACAPRPREPSRATA